jgi:tetratricopeptide (TPR) repeat protein
MKLLNLTIKLAQSIEYYMKGLDNSASSDIDLINSYNRIGYLYINKGDYDNSLEYYLKSLPLTNH